MSGISSWLGFDKITAALRKRIARFAVQKSLGKFLKYKVELDQIHSADLDTFSLTGLELDAEYLSSLLEETPFSVAYGYIGTIEGFIPFKNLLEEGCRVAVDGIDLILIPRNGAHDPHMPDSADIVASFEKNLDEFQHELARELDETVKSESVDAPAELSRQYSEDACDEREEGLDDLTYFVKSIMSRMTGDIKNLRIFFAENTDSKELNNDAKSGALLVYITTLTLRDTTSHTAAPTRDNDHIRMDVAVSPETHKELLIGSIELRYTESALPFFSPDFLDSKDSMGKVILQSSFPSMNRQQYHQDYFALLLRSHPSAHQCKMEARGVLHDIRAVLDSRTIRRLHALFLLFSEFPPPTTKPHPATSSTANETSHSQTPKDTSQQDILFSIRFRQMLVSAVYDPTADVLETNSSGLLSICDLGIAQDSQHFIQFQQTLPKESLLVWLHDMTVDALIADSDRRNTRISLRDGALLEFSPSHINGTSTLISFEHDNSLKQSQNNHQDVPPVCLDPVIDIILAKSQTSAPNQESLSHTFSASQSSSPDLTARNNNTKTKPPDDTQSRQFLPRLRFDALGSISDMERTVRVFIGCLMVRADLTVFDRMYFLLSSMGDKDLCQSQASCSSQYYSNDMVDSKSAYEPVKPSIRIVVSTKSLHLLFQPAFPNIVSPPCLAIPSGPPLVPKYRDDAFSVRFWNLTVEINTILQLSMDSIRKTCMGFVNANPLDISSESWMKPTIPTIQMKACFPNLELSLCAGFHGRKEDIPIVTVGDASLFRKEDNQQLQRQCPRSGLRTDDENNSLPDKRGSPLDFDGNVTSGKVQRDTDSVLNDVQLGKPTCQQTACQLHILLKSEPPVGFETTQRVYTDPTEFLFHKTANRELLHPKVPKKMREFTMKAWCHAEYDIALDLPHIELVMPKECMDQLYQLLMDVSEWTPWCPKINVVVNDDAAHIPGHTASYVMRDGNRNSCRTSCSTLNQGASSIDTADHAIQHRARERHVDGSNFDARSSSATTTLDETDSEVDKLSESKNKKPIPSKHKWLPHLACVTVTASSGRIVMVEKMSTHSSLPRNILPKPTRFELSFDHTQFAIILGINGISSNRDIVFSCLHPCLTQHNDRPQQSICLVEAQHCHNSLDQLLNEISQDRETDLAVPHFPELKLVVMMRSSVPRTTTLCMQVSGVRFHYHMDPFGIWLNRIIKFLDFADPPDWPKPKSTDESTAGVLRLSAMFLNADILYRPKRLPSAIVVDISRFAVTSNIFSGYPQTTITFDVDDIHVRLIDDAAHALEQWHTEHRQLHEHQVYQQQDWFAVGWRQVLSSVYLHIHLRLCDDPQLAPDLDVLIANRTGVINLCADSFITFFELMNYIIEDGDLPDTPTKQNTFDTYPAETCSTPVSTSAETINKQNRNRKVATDAQIETIVPTSNNGDVLSNAQNTEDICNVSGTKTQSNKDDGAVVDFASCNLENDDDDDQFFSAIEFLPEISHTESATSEYHCDGESRQTYNEMLQRMVTGDDSDSFVRDENPSNVNATSAAARNHTSSERTEIDDVPLGLPLVAGSEMTASYWQRAQSDALHASNISSVPATESNSEKRPYNSTYEARDEDIIPMIEEHFAQMPVQSQSHRNFMEPKSTFASVPKNEILTSCAGRDTLDGNASQASRDETNLKPHIAMKAYLDEREEDTMLDGQHILEDEVNSELQVHQMMASTYEEDTLRQSNYSEEELLNELEHSFVDWDPDIPCKSNRSEVAGENPRNEVNELGNVTDHRRRHHLNPLHYDCTPGTISLQALSATTVDDPDTKVLPNDTSPISLSMDQSFISERIHVVENHFRPGEDNNTDICAYDFLPQPRRRITLRKIELSVRFHEGKDWVRIGNYREAPNAPMQHTQTDMATGMAAGMAAGIHSPTTNRPVTENDDAVNERKRTGSSASNRSQHSTYSHSDGFEWDRHLGPRCDDAYLEVKADGMTVLHEKYETGQPYSSRLVLTVRQLDVRDNLPFSLIHTFITNFSSSDMPRESDSNMIRLEMMVVRSPGISRSEDIDDSTTTEAVLNIGILPLRIHLDQDALNFLVRFLTFSPANERIDENWHLVDVQENLEGRRANFESNGMHASQDTICPDDQEGRGNDFTCVNVEIMTDSERQQHVYSYKRDVGDFVHTSFGNARFQDSPHFSDPHIHRQRTNESTSCNISETFFDAASNIFSKVTHSNEYNDFEARQREFHDADEESSTQEFTFDGHSSTSVSSDSQTYTFFKRVCITPIVLVVDYEPKHVKLSNLVSGDAREMAGIISLRNAKLYFPSVDARGVSGWDGLLVEITNVWQQSLLTAPQAYNLVMAGVPGGTSAHEIIRAGARVFQEPFSQYPYIIHGLKDGLVSGLRTTAVESCTVATAIVFAIQTAAEVVHDMTGVEDDNLLQGPRYYRSKLAMQPTGFKDGLSKAYSALGASVKEAYSDIFIRPQEQSRRRGTSAVLRAIGSVPGAGLRPIIGACQAAALTLQGIRNGLSPERRRDLQNKYKP